jgi:hypothetical protein
LPDGAVQEAFFGQLGKNLFQHSARDPIIGRGLACGGKAFAGSQNTVEHCSSQRAVHIASPQTPGANRRQERTLQCPHAWKLPMVYFSDSNRLWKTDHCHHTMWEESKSRHNMNRLFVLVLISIGTQALPAQSNPMSASIKRDYQGVRDYFIRAAEKMPEANYGFKPSPDVRSFAQQVAHVADDQYNLCAPAKSETRKAAYTAIEDTLSQKADLMPALKEAFAYCDSAYDALTDASGAEPAGTKGRTKFGQLNWNLWHTWEHYGNVVVYLRMKGLVPPSSEPRPAK